MMRKLKRRTWLWLTGQSSLVLDESHWFEYSQKRFDSASFGLACSANVALSIFTAADSKKSSTSIDTCEPAKLLLFSPRSASLRASVRGVL